MKERESRRVVEERRGATRETDRERNRGRERIEKVFGSRFLS